MQVGCHSFESFNMGRKNEQISLLIKAKLYLQRRIAVRCVLFINHQAPLDILKTFSLLLSPYLSKERYGGALVLSM